MTINLLSIGHSNLPAERLVQMLQNAGVSAVADVRSVPASRFCPWFSREPLAARLARGGIAYAFHGGALGGRPRDQGLYCDGVADYEAMAMQADYRAGLDQLIEVAKNATVCMLCAEREPLDCHRCLLLARSLREHGLNVGHILHNGMIESHTATEQRLLALDAESCNLSCNLSCDLFASGQPMRLAAAYRRRARVMAYRRKTPTLRMTGPR